MTVDVARVPRRTLAPGKVLYRIHAADLSPWYFSADGSGRFDPVATPDCGACYLADDPLGAWVEKFRTAMVVAEEDVGARALATVTLDRAFVVADLTDRKALQAGVTAALSSGDLYEEPHRFADALQGHAEGVRWRVRHDLGAQLIGVALFGPSGPAAPEQWPPSTSQPIPRDLIREAEDAFGYSIVPRP